MMFVISQEIGEEKVLDLILSSKLHVRNISFYQHTTTDVWLINNRETI